MVTNRTPFNIYNTTTWRTSNHHEKSWNGVVAWKTLSSTGLRSALPRVCPHFQFSWLLYITLHLAQRGWSPSERLSMCVMYNLVVKHFLRGVHMNMSGWLNCTTTIVNTISGFLRFSSCCFSACWRIGGQCFRFARTQSGFIRICWPAEAATGPRLPEGACSSLRRDPGALGLVESYLTHAAPGHGLGYLWTSLAEACR